MALQKLKREGYLYPVNSSTDNSASITDSESVVKFNQVSKVFNNGTVSLKDVSLDIVKGSFVAIVGPSGCGKSSLLKLISELETATSGAVEIDTSRVGYVFQDATLLSWRTVLENVELFAELHGVEKTKRREQALQALEKVGLAKFAHVYPDALSGGMKMRASLARSLVLQPNVFLFDEPFGALDEITRERLHQELLDLYLTENFTGIFVTHSIQEAVFLASRVVVMSARPGQIIADFNVDLPYPRNSDTRFSENFGQICKQVQHALQEAYQL